MTYKVLRKNRKLGIYKDFAFVYSPPRFIKLNTKADLEKLADKFNKTGTNDINSIIEWETEMRPESKY